MLQMLWLREETEGKLQMLLSSRKNALTSLFKKVRAFKVTAFPCENQTKNHRRASAGRRQNQNHIKKQILGGRCGYFFVAAREGEGRVRGAGRGGSIFYWKSQEGARGRGLVAWSRVSEIRAIRANRPDALCEWFARIDSRESRCESPMPLRAEGPGRIGELRGGG